MLRVVRFWADSATSAIEAACSSVALAISLPSRLSSVSPAVILLDLIDNPVDSSKDFVQDSGAFIHGPEGEIGLSASWFIPWTVWKSGLDLGNEGCNLLGGLPVCSARFRTSSATTENPRPCFSARAASMAAFRAKRSVWSAMLPMRLTMLLISSDS